MEKIKDVTLYLDDFYNTFPSVCRGKDGTYYLTFRHAPDRRAKIGKITHCDHESVAYMMTSGDGENWSEPRVILRGEGSSIQDPCITALRDGSILVTTFIWQLEPSHKQEMLKKVLPGYPEFYHSDYDDNVAYLDGTYSFISRDGGKTFEGPYLIEKTYALRGQPAELDDGTILVPLYGSDSSGENINVIYSSVDGGISWRPYSFVYKGGEGEPGLFMTKSGRLCCFIRTTSTMLYCFSDDRGLTWGEPIDSGLYSSVPYNALALPDGRVFLSYGKRSSPCGIRALLLDAELNGISRENEIVIRDDAGSHDISYNAAVLLPNGDILSVYYFHYKDKFEARRHIAGSILRP